MLARLLCLPVAILPLAGAEDGTEGAGRAAKKETGGGFLGIVMQASHTSGAERESSPAIQVQRVVPDSAAEKAGLAVGDLIVAADGKNVVDAGKAKNQETGEAN